MKKKTSEEPLPSLAELEAEAEAYGRQVARQYLQEKLQQLVDRDEVFPPQRPAAVAPPATRPAVARRPRRP